MKVKILKQLEKYHKLLFVTDAAMNLAPNLDEKRQITENIVSAKHKRQLIFSSHNANIAVNGDAELILTFDHNSDKSAGEIIGSGSIDKEEIKLQVKDIMEGGVVAFEMRKTKYDF